MRLFVAACLLSASLAAQDSRAVKPNVVLIVADDQAWTDFGFLGSDEIQTPHLDRLAAEGLVFPRGYVPTALCRASLATMITGLYPHQHKITGNDPPPGTARDAMLTHIEAVETLPKLLGRAGYRSLQTGKWWEGDCTCGGFTEGMTHGDPERGGRHGDDGLTIGRETMQPIFDFIDECEAEGAPFFVWYAPFLPHTPHNPPERLLAPYQEPGVPESIAKYRAMCTWFDETCGELLGYLEERGLTRDTLVVLVSDNGWIQRPDGRGFAPRSKRSPYEGGVRTPIVLRRPGTIEPKRIDVPVSSVDIAPTVLAACGLEVPADWPGVDLRVDAEDRGPVFGAAFTHDVVDVNDPARSLLTRWIVRDPFKLLVHADEGKAEELFDLRSDPAEEAPLDDAATATELRAELDRWWPGEPRRPNLLLVVTDDQRFDQMSCAGHPTLRTPTLDALARDGARFTNAFVTTPICAASRASILTGRYEGTHGYTFGTPPMNAELAKDTYVARLKDAGYRTGFVGKWGVRFEEGLARGLFDSFRGLSLPYRAEGKAHLTERMADEAIAFLEGGSDEPFCLTLSFWAPHAEDGHEDQYLPPEDLEALYADAEVPVPPLAGIGFDALPPFLQESLGRERWGWRFDTREKQVRRTKDYWRMISGVDRALGRVLDALRDRGVADNTVVVFTSDNGYFLGERGLAGKWFVYEESIRVPLVVFDPRAAGAHRGVLRDPMVLNVDLAPTLLDLADLEIPPSYQGRSLLPLLRGESPEWRTEFLFEHRFDHAKIPQSVGVRGERWVYARYDRLDPPFEQLFDLANDPDQLHDLARDATFATTLESQRALCDALRGR